MNTILVVTTICAVALALGAIAALLVSRRDERRRSEARVAALRRIAGADVSADLAASIEAGDLVTYENHAAGRAMFGDASAESPWSRRAAAAAIVAVLVAGAGYMLLPRSTSLVPGSPGTADAAKTAPPLELLSLRQSQENGRLVITGLVQNPRSGVTLTRVIATAFLFGGDGTFLASGRAPLDFSTLTAGDESPFVLSVPVTVPVARYRVGFRGEDGRVIAHVDRRATGTLAHSGE